MTGKKTEKEKNNERIIPDLLKIEHEYLFSNINSGPDGRLSLELKCLSLVLILYLPGLVAAYFEGTWDIYVYDDWRRARAESRILQLTFGVFGSGKL